MRYLKNGIRVVYKHKSWKYSLEYFICFNLIYVQRKHNLCYSVISDYKYWILQESGRGCYFKTFFWKIYDDLNYAIFKFSNNPWNDAEDFHPFLTRNTKIKTHLAHILHVLYLQSIILLIHLIIFKFCFDIS